MIIAETDRLVLRHLVPDDAGFYFRQVNEPSWIAHIGDRQVRSLQDAESQIRSRIVASYTQHGFGMYLVELKASGTPIGLCGLLKRDLLPDPDIGFALLEAHCGRGYAQEAARAVLDQAFRTLGLPRLLAITSPGNDRSGKLLDQLGFRFQGLTNLGQEMLKLWVLASPSPAGSDPAAPGGAAG